MQQFLYQILSAYFSMLIHHPLTEKNNYIQFLNIPEEKN